MTTKAPSPVRSFPEDSLEKAAYMSVNAVPTREPNDRNRLGYHIWRWLVGKQGTLEEAIRESGARLTIPAQDAATMIKETLQKRGLLSPKTPPIPPAV
jgi:hypothetical protein